MRIVCFYNGSNDPIEKFEGVVGEETSLVDSIGNKLYVGDTVYAVPHYFEDEEEVANDILFVVGYDKRVVNSDYNSQFIMGLARSNFIAVNSSNKEKLSAVQQKLKEIDIYCTSGEEMLNSVGTSAKELYNGEKNRWIIIKAFTHDEISDGKSFPFYKHLMIKTIDDKDYYDRIKRSKE